MGDSECIPANFLGLSADAARYESARIVVLPIPFEATTSYMAGTRTGPDAILAASRQVETYDADLDFDLAGAPIHTFAYLAPDFSAPEAMTRRIEEVASRLAADSKWVLGLGGEHSVTLGLVRDAARTVPKPGRKRGGGAGKSRRLSILQIDAHLDLRDQWEGTPYSHAAVMRRCVEDGHRTVHVGIRNACREEVEFAKAERLPVFWARRCAESDDWIDEAVAALSGPVYVTVDVDGLDPSVIRGTGTPEPGGLSWWQTMRLFEKVFSRHEVVGADVVELIGGVDPAGEFAAARLAARLAALTLKPR